MKLFVTALLLNMICASLWAADLSNIAPGVGVGGVKLGMSLSEVEKIWGKPSNEDPALGLNVVSWNSPNAKEPFASILFARNEAGDAYLAQQISIFSPDAATSSGIKVGSDPSGKELAPNAKVKTRAWSGASKVMEAESAGIAIQVSDTPSPVCKAIIIHKKDVAVSPLTERK